MVGSWISLFFESITDYVGCLLRWQIQGVTVASILVVVSFFIILIKGFLYKIQG